MKRMIAIALLSALLAGCAAAPASVKMAQEKERASLLVARENLSRFGGAALEDLETALIAQIERQFDARLAALADADGRASIEEVKKEIALADAARQREQELTRKHLAALQSALKDLDNAISLNQVLGEFLNREHVSAQDVAEMFGRIDAILGEGK